METQETANNFWKYDDINAIHIELSSLCNAACPGCTRFEMNSPVVKSTLIQRSISIGEFKRWFPKELVAKIKFWIFCGTYGDPMAAKDVYEILSYVCENGNGWIQLNTNGGLRNPETYRKIGQLFARSKDIRREITFSIDGLSNSNHIYRRNVVWDKVWKNLMAYVETGASATWDYLQFKHNIHHVEEVKKIARKYTINLLLKNPFGVDKVSMPVYNKNLQLDYIIEHHTDNGYPTYVPATPDYVSPMPKKINEEGCITCHSKRNGPAPRHQESITELYVDSLGKVLPCCFVSVGMVGKGMDYAVQIQKIQEKMGTSNNLNNFSLKEIIENGVLETWSRSWKEKTIAVCWQYCGKNTEKKRVIDNLWTEK